MTDVDETRALKAAHERVKGELREFKALFKDHPELAEPDAIKALVAGNGELLKTRAELRDFQIKHHLTIALMTGRATPEGLDLLGERLARRVTVENGALRVLQIDGKTPMAGSGADGLADLTDLVKEAAGKFPMLFLAETQGGGSARSSGAPNRLGAKTMTRSTFNSLSPQAQMDRVKAGWKIVDD
jgi:hypothetical protein